jgi:hypothetical protein
VTVCTNDLALVDLAENGLPFVCSEARRDLEVLVGEMIELQHDRIGLAAVDAGPLAKKSDQEPHPFDDQGFFPT